jgi:hypothetical protein
MGADTCVNAAICRDLDELPGCDEEQVADSEAKPESPTVEVLGGRLPPWRKAAPRSSGEEAPAAAEEAAAVKADDKQEWPSLGGAPPSSNRRVPWRQSAVEPSQAVTAAKQDSSTSSSSSSSKRAPEPEALERQSSGSSEPEAEAGETQDSEVMSALQLLLWARAVAPAVADQEGAKLLALAATDIADLLPPPEEVKAPKSPQAKRATRAAAGQRKRLGSDDKAAERRPMREGGAKKLQASENSWAAQQKARKAAQEEDDEGSVARAIKSILNKLTVEKFVQLFHQLIDCGVTTTRHVEILIQEVFEKATTQHHFIDMYADLCTLCHEHFAEHPIGDDPKFSFKRLLLNQCQASFERHLTPPAGLAEMDPDERVLAEVAYKTKMLGNIKLIGALLSRKMLASKIMLAILEELLGDPTPEALESLAALLSCVGPTFDTPEWAHQPALNAVFMQAKTITQSPTTEPRARCLLKDVLDLRAAGWVNRKPKKIEGPTTLGQQAKMADANEKGCTAQVMPITLAERRAAVVLKPKAAQPVVEKKAPVAYDEEGFRGEMAKALAELRVTHDGKEAAARIASKTAPPGDLLPQELCQLLGEVAQEGREEMRKAGFEVVVSLFRDHAAAGWHKEALGGGLQIFAEEVCPDLACDVPTLPRILDEELKPALQTLVQLRLLEAALLESGPWAA